MGSKVEVASLDSLAGIPRGEKGQIVVYVGLELFLDRFQQHTHGFVPRYASAIYSCVTTDSAILELIRFCCLSEIHR